MTNYASESYWLGIIKMSLSKYFALVALSNKPMHGYEISKWIGEFTCDCCCPKEGSLYPLLKDFEETGYVVSEVVVVSGRERKVYSLTELGHQALTMGKEVWGQAALLIQKSIGDK